MLFKLIKEGDKMKKQYCRDCSRKDACSDPSCTEENDYSCFISEEEEESFYTINN